jgi:mannan endo-1,4-beta-mannosidase
MESEGITVLFRPFHEASGSWFWWGIQPDDKDALKDGSYETFQRLWYMMYDRLENYHKLSNIIWVWNGQSKYCAVDPNTYDIAGIDFYASTEDHSSVSGSYKTLASYTYEGKMLALSECGYMPDPQQCADDGVMWLYYMIWNGDFVYESGDSGTAVTDFDGTPSPNTERMTNEMLQEYFANEYFISWNDLPEFRFGTHEIPEKIRVWEYFKSN